MGSKSRLGLVGLLLVGLLTCVLGCKDKKNGIIPPPINNAPIIQTINLPDATENLPYNTTITASDPESDPITYSITGGTADTFLAINSNTGEVYNDSTITDAESGVTHSLDVRAEDDHGNYDTRTYSINVHNTNPVSGNVSDMFTGTSLEGAVVSVGIQSDTTDASGDFYIPDVNDGTHPMTVTHPNYYDSEWQVETGKGVTSTGLVYETVPKTFDMPLFDYYFRRYNGETSGDTDLGPGNGVTQRPTDTDAANWVVNICTDPAIGSGVPITQAMIDQRKDAYLNHFPAMSRGKLSFTFNQDTSTNLDAPGTSKTTYSFWNDSISEGGHAEYLTNNNIFANRNVTKTTSPMRVDYHEAYQNWGARGEETLDYPDPPTSTETVLDPNRTENTFSTWDVDAMYYNFSVPIGTSSPDKRPGIINP